VSDLELYCHCLIFA
jgi:hypothetical protein